MLISGSGVRDLDAERISRWGKGREDASGYAGWAKDSSIHQHHGSGFSSLLFASSETR